MFLHHNIQISMPKKSKICQASGVLNALDIPEFDDLYVSELEDNASDDDER